MNSDSVNNRPHNALWSSSSRRSTTPHFSGRRVHNDERRHRYTDYRYQPYKKRPNPQLRRVIESCKVFQKQIESNNWKTKREIQRGYAQDSFTQSLKKKEITPNKPIDYRELRVLKDVLWALVPSESWKFKNVSRVLYRLTLWGFFSLHSSKNAKLSDEQEELLSKMLQHIRNRCAEAKCIDDMESQSISNILWVVMRLAGQRAHIDAVPFLKSTVMSLLPYVELYSILPSDINSQNIATALHAFDILTEKGFPVEPLIKPIDSLVQRIESIVKESWILSKDIPNVLMSMAKLVNKKVVPIESCLKAVYLILRDARVVAESADKGHAFAEKALANIMCAVGLLVEQNMTLSPELREIVNSLLSRVTVLANSEITKQHIHPECLAKLTNAIAVLVNKGLRIESPVEKSVGALLLCIKAAITKRGRRCFLTRSVRTIFWSLARLLEHDFKLIPIFQETVKTLLPCLNGLLKSSSDVDPRTLCNLTLSVFSLIDNNIEYSENLHRTANSLLDHISSPVLVNCLGKDEVFNLLDFTHRLSGRKILPATCVQQALNALVDNIIEKKYEFTHVRCVQLLQIIASMGEAIELERATSAVDFLLNEIKSTGSTDKKYDFPILDGLLMHSARLYLSSKTAPYKRLDPLMEKLFEKLKNELIDKHFEHTVLIMAGCWLKRSYQVERTYDFNTSETESQVKAFLKSELPSIKIEEQKVLNNLMPVDLYLPNSKTCIEVQGPSHYVDGDFQFTNGKTLRKTALLKRIGYDMIEIRANLIKGPQYKNKIIDKINVLESQNRSKSFY